MAFTGFNNSTHQINNYDLNALFSISNSSNIRFQGVKFQNFNITNDINDINDSAVDQEEMSEILPDLFSLINFYHEYESIASYDTLSMGQIPSNYSSIIPDITSSNCSYVVDNMGIEYCYNVSIAPSPTSFPYEIKCETLTTQGLNAFAPGYCQYDYISNEYKKMNISYKYECLETNGSYILSKTVFKNSINCSISKYNKDIVVTRQYFTTNTEQVKFYCNLNDIKKEIDRDECILDLKGYNNNNNRYNSSTLMLLHHYMVPNGCIDSTGYICIDHETLYQVFYNDDNCSSMINSDFIGNVYKNNECDLNKIYWNLGVCWRLCWRQ